MLAIFDNCLLFFTPKGQAHLLQESLTTSQMHLDLAFESLVEQINQEGKITDEKYKTLKVLRKLAQTNFGPKIVHLAG
jgi:hypothetical protein